MNIKQRISLNSSIVLATVLLLISQSAIGQIKSVKKPAPKASPTVSTTKANPELSFQDTLDFNVLQSIKVETFKDGTADPQKLSEFWAKSSAFLDRNPTYAPVWILRAQTAILVNDESRGRKAGDVLIRTGVLESMSKQYPFVYELALELNKRDWLSDPYKLEKAKAAQDKSQQCLTESLTGYYTVVIDKTGNIIARSSGENNFYDLALTKGVSPSLKNNNNGYTAWQMATTEGRTDVVKALLVAGADPNNKDDESFMALEDAAYEGHTEVVKVLLAAGADPNIKYNDIWTALIRAAKEGHTDVVKALLAGGANPNIKGYYGDTALHSAAKLGHTEVVKALLASGGNPYIKDNDGFTALRLATQYGHTEIVRLLKQTGVR